jgi:glycosyltransferase involved in cell wall biosynthesis
MAINSNKITIFTTAYKPFIGGSELAIEYIVKRLPDFHFDIVTPRVQTSLSKKECLGNVCVHRVGIGSRLDKMLFPLLGFLKAVQISPQIIHAYQASYGGGAAFVYKIFNWKKKFILTIQEGKDLNLQSYFVKFFRGLIINRADCITAISNYLANYAKRYNKRAEIIVIPNGVDVQAFNRISNLDGYNIITVSRLVPKNGIEDLIRAMPKVIRRFPEANLEIIGSGYLYNKIASMIEDLNLTSKVKLKGNVEHINLPKYLSQTDLFVRPSYSEGLGNAYFEAMASGVPIIGTNVGGIRDFLKKDGDVGFIWDRMGNISLSDKIIEVLSDRSRLKEVASRGRELVINKYNWDIISLQFRILYHKI